jgi:hypothetical protein
MPGRRKVVEVHRTDAIFAPLEKCTELVAVRQLKCTEQVQHLELIDRVVKVHRTDATLCAVTLAKGITT